jgi:hypothetical protein
MGLFDNKTKYKIDLILENDSKQICYGLYEWVNGPACYWNLRFVFDTILFDTEQAAEDFINKLKDYPKYMEV